MGCEVSIQVHPMPPPEQDEPTAEAEPIKESKGSKVHPVEAEAEPIKNSNESTKLTRQDSLASTVTIMLDESDFQDAV